MLNPFLDNRPIPQIKVNFKVKIKTSNVEESNKWNSFFAYIMGKQKTKIEYITTSLIRNLPIYQIKVKDLCGLVCDNDYKMLLSVENLFDNKVPTDLKAFILSILQVPVAKIEEIVK